MTWEFIGDALGCDGYLELHDATGSRRHFYGLFVLLEPFTRKAIAHVADPAKQATSRACSRSNLCLRWIEVRDHLLLDVYVLAQLAAA